MSMTPVTPWLARCLLVAGATLAGSALADQGSDLTFQGDASFQGAHGGQAIQAALVDTALGETIAVKTGEVSADREPAFSFTFPGALQEGGSYAVHYWIDSNFGGGTSGNCDPMSNDHQWRVAIEPADGPVTHTEHHDPAAQSAVCDSFR